MRLLVKFAPTSVNVFFSMHSRIIVKGRDDHGSECRVLVAKETSLAAIYGKGSENRTFKLRRIQAVEANVNRSSQFDTILRAATDLPGLSKSVT